MRFSLPFVLFLGLLSGFAPAAPTVAKPPNVLMLFADDLGAQVGCYGAEQVLTPNIDKFARQGVRFSDAFCQFPVCNPSRTSMMTGRFPTNTGVVFNGTHHFRNIHEDWVTLPQYFKNQGYVTANSGKLFHGKAQDLPSWTEAIPDGVPASSRDKNGAIKESTAVVNGQTTTFTYRALSGDGEGDADYWIAENGIKLLEKYKDQPFFIGIGFHRPHALPTAPQRFYDLYDVNKIKLPPDFAEKSTVPPGFPAQSLPELNDTYYVSGPTPPALAREIIRSYYASVSFVDWNFGRVLDALNRLGLADNTIVIISSDHGYHNGEKGRWGKTTFFDIAQRVPLIISVPGSTSKGETCTDPVQLLDLYPTLASLCGLPEPPDLDGHDISPLVRDPKAPWPYPALSMAKSAGNPLAYVARTKDWLYAEWKEGEAGSVLIDRKNDPVQTKNLAGNPNLAPVVEQLKADLKKGFGAMPAAILPAPGSDKLRPGAPAGDGD